MEGMKAKSPQEVSKWVLKVFPCLKGEIYEDQV